MKKSVILPMYYVSPTGRLLVALVLALTIPAFAWAQTATWTGKVVGVADGDTITVLHDGKGERIRLYGIDCPEKWQPFGKRAKQFTSRVVYDKNVEVRPVATDRYGRTIAWVYADGTCLNEELLRAGLAWHYKRYSSEKHLAELESEARLRRGGLWSDPYAIPPWDFRRGKRTVTKPKTSVKSETRPDQKSIAYHGNIKTKKFHRPSCRYYDCSKCTAVFRSIEEALQAGYVPCGVCKPLTVEGETYVVPPGIVYHGNVKSKKFHEPSCRHYNCSDCTAKFHSRSEALQAGYVPCKVCRP